MPLSNARYAAVMREYDRRRADAEARADARREELYRTYPALAAAERDLQSLAVAQAEARIRGKAFDAAKDAEARQAILTRKAAVLAQAGLTEADLLPAWRTEQPKLADPEGWVRAEPYPASIADEVVPRWEEIKAGVDAVLARHGYVRERGVYRVAPDARRDGLLIFFCHHGLACVSIGHLLNIAPPQLLDGFFLPPASVTVLNSEEREPGVAAFRCQCMGDTSHLRAAGLPVSRSGAFGDVFPL